MGAIVELVLVGVKQLAELVPLWMNASAEQKAEIESKTRALVASLDALFKAADTKDDAATEAAKRAIAGS